MTNELYSLAIQDTANKPKRKRSLNLSNETYDIGTHVVISVSHKETKYDCLVDYIDFVKVKDLIWRTDSSNYVTTDIGGKKIYLHRLLFELQGYNLKLYEVDHINHNRLDNRSDNLRLVSKTQNLWNSSKRNPTNLTSKYKGVCFEKGRNKYACRVNCNNKTVFRGRFNTEKEAAIKYNEIAKQHFGEFAYLNTIEN